jgi:hypothetical protein
MIQINELRIGNLIQEGQVEQIDNSIDEVYYSGDGYYLSDFCCNINPIPLTEEWLLKCGFYGEINGKLFLCPNHSSFVLQKNGIIKYKGLIFNNRKDRVLKYVHQLQNLYFCLTGAELTVA